MMNEWVQERRDSRKGVSMNSQSITVTVIAALLIGLVFLGGYDMGRRNLVVDIDAYGCEKVIAAYHGVHK